MPKITITRTIRSERRVAAADVIMDEFTKAIEAKIIPRIERYFQNVVDQWSAGNRPEIETEKTKGPEFIEWYTRPTGDNAQIWDWVTNGTKPHKIPKNPKPKGSPLKFKTRYQAKTGLGGQYRGPGVATGPWASAHQVDHPGNKPRNFEKHFKRYINPAFRKEGEAAVKRGVRKFEKQPFLGTSGAVNG